MESPWAHGPAVAHSHFSTSHIAHGFASSLFPGSFRPVYFLKAHLFISWTCNPLFLPFGLNDFFIHLLTVFCPCCWASSFYWVSKDNHQQDYFKKCDQTLKRKYFLLFCFSVKKCVLRNNTKTKATQANSVQSLIYSNGVYACRYWKLVLLHLVEVE